MTLYRRLCILLLALYLVAGFTEARAATTYALKFYFYSTARGHTVLPSSYLATIPGDIYGSRKDCADAGDKSLAHYISNPLPDGSRIMVYFTCEDRQ